LKGKRYYSGFWDNSMEQINNFEKHIVQKQHHSFEVYLHIVKGASEKDS
jgi:polyphosphate kinase 2 (PPK2 family)